MIVMVIAGYLYIFKPFHFCIFYIPFEDFKDFCSLACVDLQSVVSRHVESMCTEFRG